MTDYFHYYELILVDGVQPAPGRFVALVDTDTLQRADLFGDPSGTPIVSVSGVANMAKTDDLGNVSAYVAPETYHVDIYEKDATTFVWRIPNVSMTSAKGEKGDQGNQGATGPADNTYSDLATFKASSIDRKVASLSGVDGVPDGKFFWETANAPYTADDKNIIKSDANDLSVGAWVRQKAEGILAADGNTVQQNLDHGGSFTPSGASAVALQTAYRLQQELFLTDYVHLVEAGDWTAAIVQWLADCSALGMPGRGTSGFFKYAGDIDVPVGVEVFGAGPNSTFFVKTGPGTWTFQKGVLRDFYLGPLFAKIDGDTSHGLVLKGVDRKHVTSVWSQYHGGDGIQYQRGNLTYVDVNCRFNYGKGFYCPAETISGDNKNLDGRIEATGNGLSGFVIDDSGTSVQTGGQFGCRVAAQSNGTRNVTDDNYDMIAAGTGHTMINTYQESGVGSLWAKSTLKMAYLDFGQNSFTTLRIECDKSNVIRRISGVGVRSKTVDNMDELILQGQPSKVGQLDWYQSADRAWNLDALGSSAAQTLTLGSTLSLAKGGFTFARKVYRGATLNFGTVSGTVPNNSKELTITVTGMAEAVATNIAIPYAAPQPAVTVPAGVSWCAYLTGGADPTTDPPVIHIRCVNSTGADVTVPSGGWIAGFVL